jgi:hypothetical protein
MRGSFFKPRSYPLWVTCEIFKIYDSITKNNGNITILNEFSEGPYTSFTCAIVNS